MWQNISCDKKKEAPSMRQLKRTVRIGNLTIGGSNPIAVQTMLNVPVKDIAGNVEQAKRVAKAGCQIVRVTVPTPADAAVVAAIKEVVDIPVVADIHFDYKAALAAIDAGADKIRINPGNIGDDDRVKAVADACNAKNIPIRIGVNGGSLEKHILARYGAPVPEAMVESAMYHVRLLEKHDFNNIVISIKSSNVPRMMTAYRMLSAQTEYPLHVGVTEAGGNRMGLIKSGMGIGGLLLEGIGDTLRVSLTGDPEDEVYAGYDILRAVGYAVAGPEIISCPTCGRTQYPMIEIANEVEARLKAEGFQKPLKIAIMGCIVNGPGEASDADIGIAGGRDEALLFIHGQRVRMLKDNIVDQFIEEIHKL
ncbi:MAG: flavodoxin-dependent (E)-4-hydroxy-3-methylbut-2-enyl-diphosphate synthase [bacterium]|uniref:flavodoxin-dependent (E)-4-hydroxy-3-methylbut-2-enyl-diphosphate synthase n=2 Tax=Gemmiger sp. TaxID=2049027 RepID=UPI002A9201A1|nr:flavodoxin-dependent (E)-4-hydroxy-3-methylbut-2-enyl-diphosphate synthase [Gemmiger sp.]MDD5857739.1 flavodoxin-dependent (E)-4-hydroxy-3-methylbut-2-enyl-diphosphate synthase [bacterium]MDY5326134.1 flavodoxin-dependent (E)-4-hydroxy-3-methylbut-2-enyl-diphosphate synthase [Gemmiger sp.]MDY5782542.1 flavodoxin-dependent (E)-4-hydroxy-3-methylbut-2-enyl-diphosphate synthase [Gemmiger sp.]